MRATPLFVFAAGDPSAFFRLQDVRLAQKTGVVECPACGDFGGTVPAGAGRASFRLPGDDPLGTIEPLSWTHFPPLRLSRVFNVIDRRRITCAGGTAGLDLAIELIEREQGHALAARVSEWFIRTEPRAADKSQRLSLRERIGTSNERVLRVIAKMEADYR